MAPNENAVIQAGVSVHTPGRDLTDRVVDAIEHRIAQLRTPPGWMHRLPPPLPSWFDAARAVEAAFNGQPTASFLAPMPTMGGAAGMGAPGVPGMGLGALRPGNIPGMGMDAFTQTQGIGMGASRPGSFPRSRTRSSRFQPRPVPQPPRFPEWTPPANTQPGMVNPFTLLSSSFAGALSNPSQTGAQSQMNPLQTGAQSTANTVPTWLQSFMNPSQQSSSSQSEMSLLDLLRLSGTGTGSNIMG